MEKRSLSCKIKAALGKQIALALGLMAILLLAPAPAAYATEGGCAAGVHQDVLVEQVNPTETENGFMAYQCQQCGRQYTDVLFATGHSWGEWKVQLPATCTTEGIRYRVCPLHNNHAEYEAIPVVGHSYTAKTTAGTCTAAGLVTYTCANCGDQYTEAAAKPQGHEYEETGAVPAACEEDGSRTFTCKHCGDSYTEAIEATGHSYGEWVVMAVAKAGKPGVQTATCKHCGHQKEQSIAALPISSQPEPQPAPQSAIKPVDVVIASSNIGLLVVFSILIYSDIKLIRWVNQKRQEVLRRKNSSGEDDGFGFV